MTDASQASPVRFIRLLGQMCDLHIFLSELPFFIRVLPFHRDILSVGEIRF